MSAFFIALGIVAVGWALVVGGWLALQNWRLERAIDRHSLSDEERERAALAYEHQRQGRLVRVDSERVVEVEPAPLVIDLDALTRSQ